MRTYSEHDIDKLDELPSHSAKPPRGRGIELRKDEKWTYPYRRAKRWVRSHLGKPFDKVFSYWVSLDWIPIEERNRKGFERALDVDTLADIDGKWVQVFSIWGYHWFNEEWNGLHIHPVTKCIAFKKGPPKTLSWKERCDIEDAKICVIVNDYKQLYKFDGIWYEIYIPTTVRAYHQQTHQLHIVDVPRRTPLHRIKLKWPYEATVRPKHGKRQLNGKELKHYNLKND